MLSDVLGNTSHFVSVFSFVELEAIVDSQAGLGTDAKWISVFSNYSRADIYGCRSG